jgi:hypothetical protein
MWRTEGSGEKSVKNVRRSKHPARWSGLRGMPFEGLISQLLDLVALSFDLVCPNPGVLTGSISTVYLFLEIRLILCEQSFLLFKRLATWVNLEILLHDWNESIGFDDWRSTLSPRLNESDIMEEHS